MTVRLGGGVDQANDPFLADSPSVLGAENVRFDDRGALSKRSGHEALTTPSAANSVHDVAGTLAVWSPGGAWQFDEYAGAWLDMNECAPRPSRVLTDPIARGNNSLSRADFAMIGSLACVAWQDDTEGVVYYEFVDFSTGRPQVLARRLAETIKGNPRLVTTSAKGGVSAQFVLVGSNNVSGSAGTLHACTYDIGDGGYLFTTPGSLGISVAAAVNAPSDVWDVCAPGVSNAYYAVVSNPFGGTDALFTRCEATGAVASTTATAFRGWACTYNEASGNVVAVGTDEDGNWIHIARVDLMLVGTPVVSSLATLTNPKVNCQRATICQSTALGKMVAAVSGRRDVQTSSSTEVGLGTDVIDITTSHGLSDQGFVRSMAIAAKARYGLALGEAVALLPLCENASEVALAGQTNTTLDATLTPAPVGLLCRPQVDAGGDLSVAVVGRFLVDKIAKASDGWHLSHVAAYEADAYFAATVLTDGGPSSDLRRTQIDLVRANVFAAPPVRSVTAQGLRLAAGGAGLVCFDGGNVVECTPPMVTVVTGGEQDPDFTGSGSIAGMPDPGDGTELFPIRLCHRWVDARGNIHRGAPSDVFIIAPSSGGPNNPSLLFGISAPEPTAMNGDRLQVMDIEVYQAEQPDQETWHRIAICTPRAHPTVPGWISITAVHAVEPLSALPAHGFYLLPGVSLEGYPQLYSEAEAANMPPPPLLDLCSTQSRLWGLSAESRLDVFYTKPLVSGHAPAFYGASTPVPAEGGEGVGIAALDDKIVVFKERNVFVLFGSPGDANGEGSTLQTPRLVSGDVGCSNVNSIVEGPFGVAFLSERGFYTLSRGMAFEFIGEAVKDVVGDETVTSGVLVPSQSEVRWTFGTDEAVVWNFRTNAWAHWTSFDAVHATLWRGRHARAAVGDLYVETPDAWADGASETMTITTAWLKLSGLQRYVRIRRGIFLGRHYTGGVRIEVGYDYAPDWIDLVEWSYDELVALRASDGRVQLQLNQSMQKCEAIRYRITGLVAGEGQEFSPGQAIDLVGIDLELGVRPGTFRNISSDAKR